MNTNNPWHGLLFLQGHIADQALAQSLARGESRPDASDGTQARSLLRSLVLLGGRPMHAGVNLDVEEPLSEPVVRPPVHGDVARTTEVACQTC